LKFRHELKALLEISIQEIFCHKSVAQNLFRRSTGFFTIAVGKVDALVFDSAVPVGFANVGTDLSHAPEKRASGIAGTFSRGAWLRAALGTDAPGRIGGNALKRRETLVAFRTGNSESRGSTSRQNQERQGQKTNHVRGLTQETEGLPTSNEKPV